MKVDVKCYLERGILVQQTDGILTFLDERKITKINFEVFNLAVKYSRFWCPLVSNYEV